MYSMNYNGHNKAGHFKATKKANRSEKIHLRLSRARTRQCLFDLRFGVLTLVRFFVCFAHDCGVALVITYHNNRVMLCSYYVDIQNMRIKVPDPANTGTACTSEAHAGDA